MVNFTFFVQFFLYLQFILSIECSESEFNYERLGPDYWKVKFPNSCNGKSQSPIDINTKRAIYSSLLGDIKFENYNNVINWDLKNNGHTVVGYQVDSSVVPSISLAFNDGNIYKEDQFNLVQFHFHWGFNNYQGSEHYFDDVKFPLEMHLAHKSKNGALAIISILFELSNETNTDLNAVLTAVNLDKEVDRYVITQFSLESLLDTKKLSSHGYYRYSGSVSTPPCTEGVIWTVFNSKIQISSAQLEAFRKNDVLINFRDVQPLNKRIVYTNIKKRNFKNKKEKVFLLEFI